MKFQFIRVEKYLQRPKKFREFSIASSVFWNRLPEFTVRKRSGTAARYTVYTSGLNGDTVYRQVRLWMPAAGRHPPRPNPFPSWWWWCRSCSVPVASWRTGWWNVQKQRKFSAMASSSWSALSLCPSGSPERLDCRVLFRRRMTSRRHGQYDLSLESGTVTYFGSTILLLFS